MGFSAGLDNMKKAQFSWVCQETKHNTWEVLIIS